MLMAWPNMFKTRSSQRSSRSAYPHPALRATFSQREKGRAPPSPGGRGWGGGERGGMTSSLPPQPLVQPVHSPGELRTGEGVDDPAVLHDEKSVGQSRGETEILFDEQDRETLPLELGDGAADLLNDDRRETLRRFVEHQESRAGAQDPGNRQHLLFAPRQLASAACEALAQIGKEREDPLDAHRARLANLRRKEQILLDRQTGEYRAFLRTEGDAEAGDAIDREIDEFLAAEHDRSGSLADDAHDRFQGRRFAGPVASKQGDDLAFPHVEIDPVENVRLVVPGLQASDAEHSRPARRRCRSERRFSHSPLPYRPASPPRSLTPRDSRLPPERAHASGR